MNTYNGYFTPEEIGQLNELVDGWTFWNSDQYYARMDVRPDGRIVQSSVHNLLMSILISKRAGHL